LANPDPFQNRTVHKIILPLLLELYKTINAKLYLKMFKNSQFKLLLIFSIAITPIDTFAQSTGKISGTIKDTSAALEFVTVTLAKSSDTAKVLHYTSTDSLGNYFFDKVILGSYQIKFSYIGHYTHSETILLTAEKPIFELKDFMLVASTKKMQAVIISTQKKLIEKTPEGFIINASATITQTGGTATDILKNTPTVSVDADGAITLRGKTPLILINGRNSTMANPDQIPASSIESIEIITTATSKYDANAESGIINIKLKKNKQAGTNGAFALSTGFGSKGRISSSLIVNHKTKKWNFGFGYDNRFAGRTRKINGSRTNYFLADENVLTQNRNDKRLEQLQNIKFNIDFSPNTKSSISFEAIGSTEGQDNNELLNTFLLKKNYIFNSNTNRLSNEIARGKAAEFALDYNYKFTDERKLFTASLTSSINKDKENTDIASQSLTETYSKIGNPFLERTHNYEDGNISNAKVDFAFPLSSKATIETGFKGIFRSVKADFENSTNVNGTYIVNILNSTIFNYTENVQAIYVLYNSKFGNSETSNWKYNFGIRGEQVFNKGSAQNNSSNFKNKYLKLFPTASLTFNRTSDEYIKLSYSKRINRPSLGQLNPFTDITDALNPHSGNPGLKPEIIQAIELGYSKEGGKFSLSTNLFYRYSTNTIRQYSQLQPNGANLTLPVNIGNATTYGVENIFTAKVSAFYDFNTSVSLFQQNINASNVAADAVQNALGWYGKFINNFVPFKKSKLQIIGNYNSALATPQGKRKAQYFVDLGYQQKLGKGNSRLGLTLVDIFNTLKSGYINNTFVFTNNRTSKADTRAIMLTFAYSFKTVFKEKLLDNQFSKEY
jgi:outer membrane receptor protein involved in Fe transport